MRELFKDPRIHFAINCASKGCPPLLNRPYEAENLEQTLETRTSLFINNPKQVFIKNNTLFASRIFRWFSPDFNDNPPGYIRRYAKGELKKQLAFAGPNIKIEFLNYDWSLNR